jgi:hypothetical protein
MPASTQLPCVTSPNKLEKPNKEQCQPPPLKASLPTKDSLPTRMPHLRLQQKKTRQQACLLTLLPLLLVALIPPPLLQNPLPHLLHLRLWVLFHCI